MISLHAILIAELAAAIAAVAFSLASILLAIAALRHGLWLIAESRRRARLATRRENIALADARLTQAADKRVRRLNP